MYYVWLGIHIFGVVIAFGLLFSVITKQDLEYKTWLVITILCCLMALTAKTLYISATEFREMVALAKLEYLGKCFANYYALLFILEYRRIKWPRWLTWGMLSVNVGMFGIIMTCDLHRLYYSSMGMKDTPFGSILVLGKAPLYYFYMGFVLLELILYLYLSTGLLIQQWHVKERRRLHLILVGAGLAPCLLLFLHVIGFTSGQDMTPIGILVAATLFVGAVNHYGLFDLVRNAKDSIVENISEGILVMDRSMNVLYANPAAKKIWRRVRGHRTQFVPETIRKIYEQSGSIVDWKDRKYEIRSAELGTDSEQGGYLLSVIDVTKVAQQADEMKRLKEEAEEANRSKSLFLAKMSHEIRTPINAVINMNEMILRESREPDIKSYAMDVSTAAKSLLSIINDILDMSKIESNKMELLPVEYELSSLLNDVLNMVMVRAQEKDLAFDISVNPALPAALYGDDVRIRQILVNLLSNAVKYTLEGSVSLDVDGEVTGDQVILKFIVKDTGIGIKQEDMPKLYEMFQRIEEVRNRRVEGTGLGMNITVQLLKMMGSTLHVESVYGEGSTFSFELVQKIVRPEAIGDFQERAREIGQEYSYTNSFIAPDAKILLVDDVEMNCKVFCNLLKQTKLQITDVRSGMECLEKVCESHYDIIFMDHMMPDMDGVETLHRLKTLENNLCEDTPVIVLTANAVTGARESYLKEGFDDFLSKPIVPEKLERLIQQYLPEDMVKTDFISSEQSLVEDVVLPDVTGINWEYGKIYFPDNDLLLQTAVDFYKGSEREQALLQDLYENRDSSLEEYRIRVHAIKSTTAMIGAMTVSTLAALLEQACRENTEKIELLQPLLMEELQKLRENMEVLVQRTEGNPENGVGQAGFDLTVEQNRSWFVSQLDMLQNALEEYDYDSADMCMEALHTNNYQDPINRHVEALGQYIADFDMEHARAELADTLKHMKGAK